MDAPWLCIEQTNNVVVATTNATELTEVKAGDLFEELAGRIRYDGAQFLVLNLASVQMVTSACLEVLVRLFQELEHIRGQVVLVNCQPYVASVFRTTRLDAVFNLYDDLDEAREKVTRLRG